MSEPTIIFEPANIAALLAQMEGVEQQPRHLTEANWLREHGVTLAAPPPPPLDGLREALRSAAQDYHEAAMALRSGFSVHDGPDFEKCPDIRCGQYRAAALREGETPTAGGMNDE